MTFRNELKVCSSCFALAVTLACARADAAQAELKVVATTKPIHALVAGVMEGIGVPELIVSGSASPHTFSLKPSGASAINSASVVFRVSPAVEPFTVKIAAALPAAVKLVTLADAPGVRQLQTRSGDTFELVKADADHDHGAAETPHGHSHDHDHMDGHVWLDPENAKQMVAEIARVLADASPADAGRLQANAAKVTAEISDMDRELKAELDPVRASPYVVFHDAYQYFERHYGLTPVGAITTRPDAQPGARRLAELRRKVRELGVVCAFAEPQFSSNVVQAVIDGQAVRFGTLDPEGAQVEPGPGAYVRLMRNLSASLRVCLSR